MSSTLEKLVQTFNGSNYIQWADSMKAWLRSQGLWQITSGAEQKPPPAPPLTATNATLVADASAKLQNWSNKNDQAIGSLVLR